MHSPTLPALALTVFLSLDLYAVPAKLEPPQIEDIYLTDAVATPITLKDGRSAIYCRSWVDEKTHQMRQSLWRVDDSGPAHPMEPGEPDGYSPMLTPNGEWILFYSARAFPDDTPAFTPVPRYSDTAADLWLMPVAGGKAIPLVGPRKPYGRVITDRFYGRVVFSPDGKRLAFVADDGRDPRTASEKANDVVVVREDQGEGYEGYTATAVWIADLANKPGELGATKVERVTPDDAYWYGDPQWAPDGSFLVVCANRTAEQESARYSINRNFDLWKISLPRKEIKQLTAAPGPDFSPRISPDGRQIAYLSSPRKGPHIDVFNLTLVDLQTGRVKSVHDFHAQPESPTSMVSPSSPLPDDCWRDGNHIAISGFRGLPVVTQLVNIETGEVTPDAKPAPARSPPVPASNPKLPPRLRAKDEPVHWTSFDGTEVEGVLTRPPQEVAGPPYKLLVIPHGGPHYRATSGGGAMEQFFATRGYLVFQPNFRGSTGYGLKFLDADHLDFGGGDMRDILTGIEKLITDGLARRDQQYIYGVSYGGYTTTWMVGHTNQFRAAVAQNAVTDFDVMWHLSDIQSYTEYEMGGMPWEVPERMRERSPLTYASHAKTPTLILHSLNDRRCPIAMGRMFYRALKQTGVETSMVVYPDEGHGIKQPAHRADVLQRTYEWFEAHAGEK